LPAAARIAISAALTRDGLSQSVLTASDGAAGAGLGKSVAVSGRTIVVGAYEHTVDNNLEQGAAYVFTRPASGWKNLTQTAELKAGDGQASDLFGYSVAISGNTIIIGAPSHEVGSSVGQGTAYVYQMPTGGWRSTPHPTAELTSDNGGADDNFGGAVAISGRTIVVGAYLHTVGADGEQGEAYVYTEPQTGWHTTASTATDLVSANGSAVDLFGTAVAISGNTIVVGAPNHGSQAGAAYVFVKPPLGWAGVGETRSLIGADTVAGNQFGHSVAITGNTIVVGATGFHGGVGEGEGAAYVFARPTDGWGMVADPSLTDNAELTATSPMAADSLGQSVSISGSEIVAGASQRTVGGHPRQGVVYTYRRSGAAWKSETQTTTLVAAGGAATDNFGTSSAIDGTTIVSGAPGSAAGIGAAYAFTPPAPALSKVKQSRTSWSLGRAAVKVNPTHQPKAGSGFSFTLPASATVSLRFSEKNSRGRLVPKGTVTVHARKGKNSVYVDGKLGHGKKLVAGHCTVTITAKNANGTSRARPLHFTTHGKT
jgi:hypothetical protein